MRIAKHVWHEGESYGPGDESRLGGAKGVDFGFLASNGAIEDYEPGADVSASQAARDLAAEHGIDLSEVKGTGKDGSVTKGDVEKLVG